MIKVKLNENNKKKLIIQLKYIGINILRFVPFAFVYIFEPILKYLNNEREIIRMEIDLIGESNESRK